jgi:hypothetical protein
MANSLSVFEQSRRRRSVAMLSLGVLTPCAAADFASVVVDYRPAPGQYINGDVGDDGFTFNDPTSALGPPIGGGLVSANNSKQVSLGGFGGSITLGFNEAVLDDPLNRFGLDAIVYGNAFWVGGNAQRRFAEAGIIEISRDANGNGIADDAWYLIAGSDIDEHAALAAFATQQWDDDAGTATPPADIAWYPDPTIYPAIGANYTTSGFTLPAPYDPLVLDNAASPAPSVSERFFGYADLSPTLLLGDTDADNAVEDPGVTPASFYTRPDNPFAVGVTPDSGGGDAFDIAWAIDPVTGEPANLGGFDFIRISTASAAINGPFGEKSVEVGAVADVRPMPSAFDLDASGAVDVSDVYAWHRLRADGDGRADTNGDGVIDAADERLVRNASRATEAGDVENRS